MVAFANEDNNSVQAYANQLISDYGQTVYADAARLTLAKMLITDDDYDKARQTLEFAPGDRKSPALKQVAKLRIVYL